MDNSLVCRLPLAILILLLLAGGLGCGLKSNPIPPSRHAPDLVGDVHAVATREGILLSWQFSADKTEDCRVIIARSSLEGTCPSCPVEYESIADVALTDIVTGHKPMSAEFMDRSIRKGQCYTYRIRLCRAGGLCGEWSNGTENQCSPEP
jgi:hypothetical protein